QAVVEVAVDLDDLRAVHDCLCELAHGDLALRYEHGARDAGAGGVRRSRRRRVARRRAQNGLLAVRNCLGDGQGHAPVLERTGRVEALDLEMHRAACVFGKPRRGEERGAALAQGDRCPAVLDRQPVTVRGDEPRPGLVNGLGRGGAHSLVPSMRSTLLMLCTTSRSASAATVSDNAASVARWVTTTMRAPHRCPPSSTMPSWRTSAMLTSRLPNSAATADNTPGKSATFMLT